MSEPIRFQDLKGGDRFRFLTNAATELDLSIGPCVKTPGSPVEYRDEEIGWSQNVISQRALGVRSYVRQLPAKSTEPISLVEYAERIANAVIAIDEAECAAPGAPSMFYVQSFVIAEDGEPVAVATWDGMAYQVAPWAP